MSQALRVACSETSSISLTLIKTEKANRELRANRVLRETMLRKEQVIHLKAKNFPLPRNRTGSKFTVNLIFFLLISLTLIKDRQCTA